MKYLVYIVILFVTSCTQAVSQKPSAEAKKDQEFNELLKQAKAAEEKNRFVIKAADDHSKQIITKAVEKIQKLETTVKDLKVNLNEAYKKVDSVVDANTGNPYKLLPISKVSDN